MNEAIDRAVEQFRTLLTEQIARTERMERGAQATRTVLHNLHSPAAVVRYLYEGGRAHWARAGRT